MTTYDAAHDFFENTVKPTIQEFLADTTNLRKGRLAAIILYHTWDYLKDTGLTNPTEELTSPNHKLMYETIRASANASKHYRVTRHNPIASFANQVLAEQNDGLFDAPFGEGSFAEANEVHLILDETERCKYGGVEGVSLVTAVKFMQNYWECRLNNLPHP